MSLTKLETSPVSSVPEYCRSTRKISPLVMRASRFMSIFSKAFTSSRSSLFSSWSTTADTNSEMSMVELLFLSHVAMIASIVSWSMSGREPATSQSSVTSMTPLPSRSSCRNLSSRSEYCDSWRPRSARSRARVCLQCVSLANSWSLDSASWQMTPSFLRTPICSCVKGCLRSSVAEARFSHFFSSMDSMMSLAARLAMSNS
mmetsp:Transcript_117555/g.379384  ORF Transcript_117555/g.379384 Transcript_117555/m.379384 type:complete len:202 (-) Transcript_117555:1080-1685(-)